MYKLRNILNFHLFSRIILNIVFINDFFGNLHQQGRWFNPWSDIKCRRVFGKVTEPQLASWWLFDFLASATSIFKHFHKSI